MERKFRRMNQHGKIAGVCSGLAYHFWCINLDCSFNDVGLSFRIWCWTLPYFLVALRFLSMTKIQVIMKKYVNK